MVMLVSFIIPAVAIPAMMQIMLMILAYALFLNFLMRQGVLGESLPQNLRFTVVMGMMTFWICIAVLKLFQGIVSPIIVAVFTVLILLNIKRRIKKPAVVVATV